MARNILKAICIFTLVFFVMSMTAAATNTVCKANSDKFRLSPSRTVVMCCPTTKELESKLQAHRKLQTVAK